MTSIRGRNGRIIRVSRRAQFIEWSIVAAALIASVAGVVFLVWVVR